ncbi:hypothetical protein V2J09_016798 [Rumex salicifolius]
MAPPPGPYSGVSQLALVARASAFTFGVVYGNMKLKYLKLAPLGMKQNLTRRLKLLLTIDEGTDGLVSISASYAFLTDLSRKI